MLIRKATEKDLNQINAIYNESVLIETGTFDIIQRSIEERIKWFNNRKEKHIVLVAEDMNGEIAGWASVNAYSDRLAFEDTVENSVYVKKTQRGKGLGKILLEELIYHCEKAGVHTIIARVTEENKISIKIHEDLGFETVGIMKEMGKKFGRYLDLRIMQKIL